MSTVALAADTRAPTISGWLYVVCAAAVVLAAFNLWRFRTGWRMTGEHYRHGYTDFLITMGYAALPGLIAGIGMTLALVLFPFAEEQQSAQLGIGVLLGAALFAVGVVDFIKEQSRPSRWNRPPRWLKDAKASGELD